MSNIKTENPASQILPISVGAVSETGHREENQDSMTGFSSPVGAVYLIADGMGGHRGGKEASRIVAEAFTRHLLAVPESSPPRDALTLAVRLANLEILEKSKSGNPDFAGMGSTVVIALIRQTPSGLELMTAHIGDSRVYLQRDGQLNLLTKDHTQVQWLIDSQSIDEATARAHPDASVLTRALGHTTDLQVDISEPIPLAEGDAVLLCSDGLSGFASSEDIRNTIAGNPDPTNCANELVKLALACGSNDNITVQFLRIGNALPALEKPKRKTLPDAPSLSPVSVGEAAQIRTSTEKKRGRFFLLAIAVFVVLVGIVAAWYYVNQKAKPDPVLQNVRGSLDKLKAATNKFH